MRINLKNVTKQFPVYLMDSIVTFGRIILGKSQKISEARRFVTALDNVSLKVSNAERVGIIGRNGAGKTTLLQIIAGLMQSSSGILEIEGKVTCIITLGVGLKEDLTGRENIYLDGEINGRTRGEIDKAIEKIITFADIGEFIDIAVKTYSSGMRARLAFSMLIYLEPEILIIDEVLGVGDTHFLQKSSAKIKEICDKGKIVMIVSHSMGTIKEMCNRCIWLDKGKVMMDGSPEEVIQAYREFVRSEEEREFQRRFRKRIQTYSLISGLEITKLEFLDKKRNPRLMFDIGEEMMVVVGILNKNYTCEVDLKISLKRADGILLMENEANRDGFSVKLPEGYSEFEIDTGQVLFGKNLYDVMIEILDLNTKNILATRHNILKIDNPVYPYENPVFFHPVEWEIKEFKGERMRCQY
jgi:lipopolysaccharide transport system ATP-binding protein